MFEIHLKVPDGWKASPSRARREEGELLEFVHSLPQILHLEELRIDFDTEFLSPDHVGKTASFCDKLSSRLSDVRQALETRRSPAPSA